MVVRGLDIQVCEAEAIPRDVGDGWSEAIEHNDIPQWRVMTHGCGLVTDLSDQTR